MRDEDVVVTGINLVGYYLATDCARLLLLSELILVGTMLGPPRGPCVASGGGSHQSFPAWWRHLATHAEKAALVLSSNLFVCVDLRWHSLP